MDLVSAIGLISSFVTLEEAGRSWILIIKDKIKRKEIDINNWDSDDPLVQVCLDRFKTDMGDKYKDHIFSEEEIQDIILGFFEQNRELRIGHEEQKQMTQIIEDILYASVSIKVNIERVLMPFAKMPKTNRRTDILPNMVAVFRIILYYKSVTKYRRTRHTFTKSNGLYAMS